MLCKQRPPPPLPSFPAASVQGREILDPASSSQEMQEEHELVKCQQGDSISKIPTWGNSIGQTSQDPQLVDDKGEKEGEPNGMCGLCLDLDSSKPTG